MFNLKRNFIFIIITSIFVIPFSFAIPKKNMSASQHKKIATKPITEQFKLPKDINGIYITGHNIYNISVGNSSNNVVSVTGKRAIVKTIAFRVKAGILHIVYHNPAITGQKAKINLVLKNLNSIKQVGTGPVTITYHKQEKLRVRKDSISSLKINGRAIGLRYLDNRGIGNVSIAHISSNSLIVNDSGSGDVRLIGSNIHLKSLKVNKDKGRLIIQTIKSNGLTMVLDTNANVIIKGEMIVSTINFTGDGHLKMYWVKSDNLKITTHGKGTIALAGRVDILNAHAYDKSHMDLRYLRASTAYVKSYNKSIVDVWAEKNLYALAINKSNIYYYKKPKYMNKLMGDSASILSMADIQNAVLTFNTKGSF